MTSPATIERSVIPIPTDDRRPVEHAVIESIAGNVPPETWLALVFPQADGGLRIRWAWTSGGVELGDRIDVLAVGAGLDIGDCFHITDQHKRISHRGRIRIEAHPLRPILADVTAGVRCPDDRRAGLRRVLDYAAAEAGQTPVAMPGWRGVGPTLLNRKAR